VEQPELYRALGRRVRERRKALQLSQEELAARIGMPRTSVTHIERGQQQVLVHTLCALARALEATVADLLQESEGEPSVSRSRRPVRRVLSLRPLAETRRSLGS
jgi:transcriptional regulator with XRE-family HTH domain